MGDTIVQLSCVYAFGLMTPQSCYEHIADFEMKRLSHMSLRDYAGWHCDSCARLITSVRDGWVEWLASEDDSGTTILSGLRLVHRESCRYDARTVFRNRRSVVEGLCLERFIGPDGLTLFLSLLAAGELPSVEVIELTKRVQIPGYEVARNLVGGENLPQLLMPSLGHGCYLQSEITELLTRAMKDRKAA
jgi:hypothetical protein